MDRTGAGLPLLRANRKKRCKQKLAASACRRRQSLLRQKGLHFAPCLGCTPEAYNSTLRSVRSVFREKTIEFIFSLRRKNSARLFLQSHAASKNLQRFLFPCCAGHWALCGTSDFPFLRIIPVFPAGQAFFLSQKSALPVVLGWSSTSRILLTPVRYITMRSKPRP